jgi:hypothetical protein
MHGIACYAEFSHNHFDIRLENEDLKEAWYWWWPEQDGAGRDLSEDHRVCYGETSTSTKISVDSGSLSRTQLVRQGSLVPGEREVREFEAAGETLDWAD